MLGASLSGSLDGSLGLKPARGHTEARLEVDGKNLVIGQPADVIDRLKQYEELGFDQYSFWLDSNMSFERKRRSLERFISDVMPAFDAR